MVRKPLQAARLGNSNMVPVHVNFGPTHSLVKEWNISGQAMWFFRGRIFTELSSLYVCGHHSYYYELYIMMRVMLIGSKLKAFSSSSFMFAWPCLFIWCTTLHRKTTHHRIDWPDNTHMLCTAFSLYYLTNNCQILTYVYHMNLYINWPFGE